MIAMTDKQLKDILEEYKERTQWQMHCDHWEDRESGGEMSRGDADDA